MKTNQGQGKKIIFILLLLLTIFIFGLLNRQAIAAQTEAILFQSPCDNPRGYRIGSIDNRFTLTENEYSIAIKEAAEIWEKAYGKKLFVYDPEAKLAMNLVYDTRQSLNTKINQQNDELKQKDTELKPEIAEHDRKVADLERRMNLLNQEIESWNAKGGAPSEEYKRLREEQDRLRNEAKALNDEAAKLSLEAEHFNSEVQDLKQTVSAYKNALDVRPEGGQYVRDDSEEKIDIFIFSSRPDLINTIAHEFGHALGIEEHVNNPDAIMYSQANESITPSQDDLSALTLACQKQNMFLVKAAEFSYTLNKIIAGDQ